MKKLFFLLLLFIGLLSNEVEAQPTFYFFPQGNIETNVGEQIGEINTRHSLLLLLPQPHSFVRGKRESVFRVCIVLPCLSFAPLENRHEMKNVSLSRQSPRSASPRIPT